MIVTKKRGTKLNIKIRQINKELEGIFEMLGEQNTGTLTLEKSSSKN